MKQLIKGGIFLALGILTSAVAAQEIRWQAASPKNTTPATPVTISTPVPFPTGPVIRAQAADDKLPQIEVLNQDDKKKQAKPMPKDQPFPPAPNPTPFAADDCGTPGEACGLGKRWWAHLCGGDRCCPTDDCCGRPSRWWVSAEYLSWWQRSQSVPPLVTASPAGTPALNSGVLGLNSTAILYDEFPDRMRSGARFGAGFWLPRHCNVGFDFNFFFLGRQDSTSVYGSAGDPQFSRPFFNALTGTQAAEIVSNDFVTGTVSVNAFSQLWGAEANLRYKWLCKQNCWLDVLVGYRHLNLSEGIAITENLQVFDPQTGAAAGRFLVQDSFETRSQFNGIQIGLDGEWRFRPRWTFGMTTKVAVGSTHQIVDIDGATNFSNFPAPFGGTFPGGLLALPGTNIGRFTQNKFAVVPEVSFKLGYDITPHLRAYVGYDFLYWSNVVRPGDQIDLRVNPNFVPSAAGPGPGGGPRQPAVLFRTTDYWAQGVNFGLLYRY
jgi:hypothetical protein